jgi:hypothetical protein
MRKTRRKDDPIKSVAVRMCFNYKSLKLLRKQKDLLLGYTDTEEDEMDMVNACQCIIDMIDHIQDYLVDNGYFTEKQVFGKLKD